MKVSKESAKVEKTSSAKRATPSKKTTTSQLQSTLDTPKFNFLSQRNSELFWKLGMGILLVVNALLTACLLLQIQTIKDWKRMEYGGEQNLVQLQQIYATPAYQQYFKGEIQLLERKIAQFSSEENQ